MRVKSFHRVLRLLAATVLFFFVWTFGSIGQAVAWAVEKPRVRSADFGVGNETQKIVTAGERFEKALEEMREKVERTGEKHAKGEDDSTEREAIKAGRASIDQISEELRAEFSSTEKRLKAAGLSKEILTRHADFVAHFERNIKELRENLDGIEKAKTKADRQAKIEKARLHLEKTKRPSIHQKLDPNNLPFRARKATKTREPRTKEQFEKDFSPQGHKGTKTAFATDAHGWTRINTREAVSRELTRIDANGFQKTALAAKPILLAYNGPLGDLNLDLPLPSGERTEVRGDLNPKSEIFNLQSQLAFSDSSSFLLAQAGDAPTAEDLAETPDIRFTSELRQIASLLENNPVQLFEFVRNNFSYDPYYASIKGSQGTLLLQSGNDFDQISTLIGLFRISGIPARYVIGTADIPIEKVMKWMGVTKPELAAQILATNGIPAKLGYVGSTLKFIRMERIWAEVYISYSNYRGLINDPTASKTWIPLDPAFKLIEPNPDAVDLADRQQFDIDSYLTSYLQTVKPTTPAKDYLKTTMDYVTANMPGKRFYDLLVSNTIIDKVLGLLPDTLPYPVKIIGAKFSAIPDTYRHKTALEFSDPNTSETVLAYTASWADLLHNRFTLSYTPATAADEQTIANYGNIYSTPPYLIKVKPVLKVEGVTVAEGSAVGMAGDIIFKMSFIGPQGVLDTVITNNLTVGATHAIGLGSGYTTGRIITYRTARLEAAATAGETGDSIIGEYLNLLAMNYLQELDSSRKLISKSMKILDTYRTAELMVGVDLGVSRIFSIPRSVSINGLLIDVDYNISTPVDMDGNQSKVRRFQILTGMTSSSLEHTMFEAIVGAEAVSTIKALQIASEQGIPIHQIDSNNIATKLALLQLSSEVKADIQNAVNSGKKVTVSERNIQLNAWNGVGYIVLDPSTGAGAYMISSGLSGGSLTWVTRDLQYLIRTGEWTLTRAQQEILAHKSKIWFRAPVYGEVTSPYGSRGIGSGFHRGVDFSVEIGTAVMAVADGVVSRVEENHPDYGRVVYIDHGAGVETVYGHNCQLLVSPGQKVYADRSILALSGNTGRIWSRSYQGGAYLPETYPRCVTQVGAHVHFEIRVGGVQQNPQEFNMLLH